jgi:hypothetical protein
LINGNPACVCTAGHVAVVSSLDGSFTPAVRCVSQTREVMDAGTLVFGSAGASAATLDAGGGSMRIQASNRDASADAAHEKLTPSGSKGCSCDLVSGDSPPPMCATLASLLLALSRLRRRARG